MAFNWSTFWTRAFTALVFVAGMALGLLYNVQSFFILISIIHFGCWKEYISLQEKIAQKHIHPFCKFGFMLLGYHILLLFANFYIAGYNVATSYSFPFLIAELVLLIWGIFKQKMLSLKLLGNIALGFLYISLGMGLLLQLRLSNYAVIENGRSLWDQPNGFYIPIIIILSLWVNDTMAYLVGSAIGKTPFSKISPKKTIEGTVGGMLVCICAITFILKPFFHWQVLLSISLIAAVAGTAGDLLESKIKRMAGVKDSGKIMPGHGGFLDRFDSLLVTVPLVWLFFKLYYTTH